MEMNLSWKFLVYLVISIGCLVGCVDQTTPGSIVGLSKSTCTAIPDNFKEEDLVGTWVASYSLNDREILMINGDNTYKQIYYLDTDSDVYYESDLLRWYPEYRDSGYIRLHFNGMHRFGELDSIGNRLGGGIDPKKYTAIDMCEDRIVEMPNEIVLVVTGAKYNVPRGIVLKQTRLAGSNWTWSFELSEDQTTDE